MPDSREEPTVNFREMMLVDNAYRSGFSDGIQAAREAMVPPKLGHPWVDAWKHLMRPFPYPWVK